MVDAGRFREALGRFWPMVLMGLPGVAIGIWLLDRTDPMIAAAFVGIALAVYSLFARARPSLALPSQRARPLGPAVGLANGVVNGPTGSQVMPSMPHLPALRLPPDLFVQTSNIGFTAWRLARAVGLSGIGLVSGKAVALSAAGILPVILGIWLGGKVRRRLPAETSRRAALVLLLLAGGRLLLRVFV